MEVLWRTLDDTSNGPVPTDHPIPLAARHGFGPPGAPRPVGTSMANKGFTFLNALSLDANVDATLALATGNELLKVFVDFDSGDCNVISTLVAIHILA